MLAPVLFSVALMVGAQLATTSGELRFYAGGFLFEHEDFDTVLAGPKLRLEWRMDDFLAGWPGSRLTLDTTYRWDEVREHAVEAGFRIRLPFDKTAAAQTRLTPQEARMTERLERDTDIVAQGKVTKVTKSTGSPEVKEKVEDALTGVDFDRAIVVANGSDLQAATTVAGGNSLIIPQGGPTNFAQVALMKDQPLQGGGSTIAVRGLTTGQTANFTAPGTKPTIFATPASYGVQTNTNSHLAGFDIVGTLCCDTGIEAIGSSNVFINNIGIRDVANGIYVQNASNVSISNVSVRNTFTAIVVDSSNNVTIDQANLEKGEIGFIAVASQDVLLKNSTITDFIDFGVGALFSNNIRFDQISLVDTGVVPGGAAVSAIGSTNVSLTNSTIKGGDIGIQMLGDNSLTVSNVQFLATSMFLGVQLGGSDDVLHMNNSSFTGNFDTVIFNGGLNTTFSGPNNVVTPGATYVQFCSAGSPSTGTLGFPAGPSNCP